MVAVLRFAAAALLALGLSACAGPGLLGHRSLTTLENGTRITRTVGCGGFADSHAGEGRVILGCMSDVTVEIPPGVCQAVFVIKPTFTTAEILRQLDPLLPEEICPERIAAYE